MIGISFLAQVGEGLFTIDIHVDIGTDATTVRKKWLKSISLNIVEFIIYICRIKKSAKKKIARILEPAYNDFYTLWKNYNSYNHTCRYIFKVVLLDNNKYFVCNVLKMDKNLMFCVYYPIFVQRTI